MTIINYVLIGVGVGFIIYFLKYITGNWTEKHVRDFVDNKYSCFDRPYSKADEAFNTIEQYRKVLTPEDFSRFMKLFAKGNEHSFDVMVVFSKLTFEQLESDQYLRMIFWTTPYVMVTKLKEPDFQEAFEELKRDFVEHPNNKLGEDMKRTMIYLYQTN